MRVLVQRIMKTMRYLALLLIGWLSLPVYALTQVDIYRAEVAIDGEQKAAKNSLVNKVCKM